MTEVHRAAVLNFGDMKLKIYQDHTIEETVPLLINALARTSESGAFSRRNYYTFTTFDVFDLFK
jgi:hypothetical protein